METIHLVEPGAVRNGNHIYARCGLAIRIEDERRTRGQAITCDACRDLQADDEAGMAALLAEGGL